jgi:hypothetical protein
MDHNITRQSPEKAEIVDFDEALLDACPEDVRSDLMSEASLLAQAFAPEGRREQLEEMALALTAGSRDEEMGRAHARRLAAALRRLARGADA